jgi:3',5'-cyclic AMP phosphodiesterase CpdA
VYSFEFSNAFFAILDSNLRPRSQTKWLERQLSQTRAKWKFVVYHHPAYSSVPKRDNETLRKTWTPLFDKYRVDMALQGHDHAYLRTYPMRDQRRAEPGRPGTVYVVSVSGTKMYQQDPRDYTEFGMTNVATFQTLDIRIDGDRMLYRAIDGEGKVRDEFSIAK